MAKQALYLVHADVDPAVLTDWNAFHAREHVPLVVKHAGFLGAVRYRHEGDTPKLTTAYRAEGLGKVREYLEGGEVGRMRAHHDEWVKARGARVNVTRDILEENHSVDAEGKVLVRSAELVEPRACFVVRVRVDAEFVAPWANWYDRDHMPAVVREGAFLRAGRWRIVDDSGAQRFAVIYEAQSPEIVAAFRQGPGPSFSQEHAAKFGQAVSIEREVWAAIP